MHRLATLALSVALTTLPVALPAHAQDADPATKASPDGATYLPLEAGVREVSVTALQETLYELAALQHNAHQMHWNVVGSDFYQLHEFYEGLYQGLDGYIDMTGARIRALGAPVAYTLDASAEGDEIEPAEAAELDGPATYTFLLDNYAAASARLYERIAATNDDLATNDLLIGIVRAIDKDLWMLRAHTGGTPQ